MPVKQNLLKIKITWEYFELDKPIQTIEDFLNLTDWDFQPRIEQGTVGNYHWLKVDYDVPFQELITLPEQYRIIMLDFDGWGGGRLCHGSDPGWSVLGECGISDVQSGHSEVKGYAEMSWALITPRLYDDRELIPIVNSFYGINSSYGVDEIGSKFWEFIEKLQPYFFHDWHKECFFAAKDKTVLDILHSTDVLKQAEEYERQQQLKSRALIWETLGPECGPEKCVESDCDRLRIPLAIRCLMHQQSVFQ